MLPPRQSELLEGLFDRHQWLKLMWLHSCPRETQSADCQHPVEKPRNSKTTNNKAFGQFVVTSSCLENIKSIYITGKNKGLSHKTFK